VVIDKRDIGTGSTSATTAMIQYEIDEPLHKLIHRIGKAPAVDSFKAGVAAIDKLESIVVKIQSTCGFERKQSIYVASKSDDATWLKDEYHCRKENGLKVEWIDCFLLKNKFQMEGHGAILSKTGANLDAYYFTHDLIRYSLNNYSLQVFDHTEIINVDYNQNGCTAFTDSGFHIDCHTVVHASGYESRNVLKNEKIKLLSTYACVSEPLHELPALFQKAIIWNTDDPYLYLRSTIDGRILVGGADEDFRNPERRDSLIAKKEHNLWIKAANLIPDLRIIPDHAWAGTFGKTPDALPYIGRHADFPNAFFVLGFGGNGITFSLLGMKMLSDELAGIQNKFLEYFKFGR
jgi:glycine/D-amino acid oxidase-like deaminating enzyme